jgi:hypothetical protein
VRVALGRLHGLFRITTTKQSAASAGVSTQACGRQSICNGSLCWRTASDSGGEWPPVGASQCRGINRCTRPLRHGTENLGAGSLVDYLAGGGRAADGRRPVRVGPATACTKLPGLLPASRGSKKSHHNFAHLCEHSSCLHFGVDAASQPADHAARAAHGEPAALRRRLRCAHGGVQNTAQLFTYN